MIIHDTELHAMCKRGMLSPYVADNVNPASIDLTIGEGALYITEQRETVINDFIAVFPNMPVMMSTAETVCLPDNYAALVVLKSSMGRRGLSMCQAGWVDPGFAGTLSITLYAVGGPVRLHPGERFCQLVVYRMAGPAAKPYQGKYQGQHGPTMAR